MLTICSGEPQNYEQAYEFMNVVIEDLGKFDNYFNVLRRDVYLLVDRKVHEKVNQTRVAFFKQIKYKGVNKKLVDAFVNAALVESHLKLRQGAVPLEVLLELKLKANQEDWEAIYQFNVDCREIQIANLKKKQKIRKSKWRTMTLNKILPVPTITSIKKAISDYYRDSDTKPKSRVTKELMYKYWDEVNMPIEEDDEITADDLINCCYK